MKTAVITGAASGIGLATVQKFLDNGYKVYGMSRRENSPIENVNFNYISGDISKNEDREKLISAPEKIDVLVNVAGVAPKERRDILEMTQESYDYVMDINLKGTFFLTQLAANKMKENKSGYICNISSMSEYTSSVNRGEYCISKAGLSMVTKLFADRLAEYNIVVNEVRPGIIATDMTSGVQEKYDNLIEDGLLPIKRWGRPEDIADAVFALCSGALPYVTGQAIDVDGGFHIRRL
ncbi:MAG: 3-ketoacyl-ACP reductase [Clostridia bacterium]|nr:3-ketoacyl-ACP reductase [Clostridia bacterium]MBQ6708328.1 3-ketoacyl-ACP reductase [Clostridia bacterium]